MNAGRRWFVGLATATAICWRCLFFPSAAAASVPAAPAPPGKSMTFDDAFVFVIGHEGGYVNDPADKGGETKYGISRRAYPNVDIKALTLDGAKGIYYRDYWLAANCNLYPSAVALAAFDCAVNLGVYKTKALLAELVNDAKATNNDVLLVQKVLKAGPQIALKLCWRRILHYYRLTGDNRSQLKFLRGWINRTYLLAQECYKLL